VGGRRPGGQKELIAIVDGYRESEQSWMELLLDVKSRGLSIDPKLATGDGALGFWKALPKVFPSTRTQRCWVACGIASTSATSLVANLYETTNLNV
jgi:putative transposase